MSELPVLSVFSIMCLNCLYDLYLSVFSVCYQRLSDVMEVVGIVYTIELEKAAQIRYYIK